MKNRSNRRHSRRPFMSSMITAVCQQLEGRQLLSVTTGDLDPSFGSNGKVVTDLGFQEPTSDFATDIAVYQADGKFVVVGYEADSTGFWSDMVLARYNFNGSLDSTFGSGGKVLVDFSPSPNDINLNRTDLARTVQIDSHGRIVVAGTSDGACAVVRLNPDGSLDSSFSGDGKTLINLPFGLRFDCRSVALDSQGRIVLVGSTGISADRDFVAARLTTDGSLDSSFLSGGWQLIDLTAGSNDYAMSVAVDSLDRILIGGFTDNGTNGANWDFAVVRLTDNGILDATFNGTGLATVDFGGTEQASALAVDNQNRVVIVGYTSAGTSGVDFAVARLDADGSPDATFSDDGKQTVDFGTAYDFASDVAIDAQNRLVIGGTVQGRFDPDFAVARLNPDGALDIGFSGDGKQSIDFGGVSADDASAVAVDANGRILVAGERASGQSIAFGIVRLIGTQAPVANAGGPYSGTEGSFVSFDGSASINEDDVIVSYEWDLDFDGVTFHVDRTGVNQTAVFSDNFGSRTIALRTTNSNGLSSLSTTTLTIDNVKPTAGVTGPAAAVRTQLLTFFVSGNDVSSADRSNGFMYSVDFGDGVTTTVGGYNGSQSSSATHTYAQDGTYTVTVSSIDKDGSVSEPAVMTVHVSSVAVLDDPCEPGRSALFVVGSASGDTIQIRSAGNSNGLEVTINGESQGIFSPSPDGHVYVYGLEGDDDIQVNGNVTRSAWIYGGAGDDRLKGGAGDDVLFGDVGEDTLSGHSGRDFLIGGSGADRIVGNADDDILVSGWLAFDFNPYDSDPYVNLHNAVWTVDGVDRLVCGVMREWTSSRSYGERIFNISNGAQRPADGGMFAARLNGLFFLNLSTWDDLNSWSTQSVFDDDSKDVLTGSAGLDWFLFDLQQDKVTDLKDEAFADIRDWLE